MCMQTVALPTILKYFDIFLNDQKKRIYIF